MLTNDLIIRKIVNFDNNFFSINYDTSDKVDGILKIFLNCISSDINSNKTKFQKLSEIMDNFYFSMNTNKKEEFFNLFCKIQKVYHTLNNFVFSYKYKKSKLIINTDLQLNEISMNDPNVICIYHVQSRYLFKIEDLLKLIYTSLTNGNNFFSEPITIKNPYNNVPFGKSILYHIYFFLVSNTKINNMNLRHLDIFFKFKQCEFNLTKFINNYEYLLREYIIENYINNSTNEILKNIVFKIIRDFNYKFKKDNRHICISDEFPDKELIRIFKPYIHLKLISLYSLIKQKKYDSDKKLNKKLREFQEFNPQFGRKIIRFKDIIQDGKIKKIRSHIDFNIKHKKFNTYELDNFMNNHLVYKYEGYNNDDYEEEEEEEEEEEPQNEMVLISEIFVNGTLISSNNLLISNNINQYDEEEEQEYNQEDEEQEYNQEYNQEYEEQEYEDRDSIS